MIGRIEVVNKGRARYLEHDRLVKTEFEPVFFIAERKSRIVAGRARQEEFGRVKTAEIFFRGRGLGLAVGHVFAEGIDIERQQHRHRALGDAGKPLFGDGIEAGKGLAPAARPPVGQGRGRGIPIDVAQRDGRAFHLARGRGTGDQQRKAYKNGTFQQALPRSARQQVGKSARVKGIGLRHTRVARLV